MTCCILVRHRVKHCVLAHDRSKQCIRRRVMVALRRYPYSISAHKSQPRAKQPPNHHEDLSNSHRLLRFCWARIARGRGTRRVDRIINDLMETIDEIQDQIGQLSSGGGGGGGGNLVTLAELAALAIQRSEFDELSDFDDDFGANDATELLSRTSRSQQGFLDFFFQSMRCPLSFQNRSSTREGDQIDRLRLSVARALNVQINEFLCPSRL